MNRICLIGLVGCWPRPVGPAGDLGFVLLTERDPLGQRVDRHRVILGGIHLPDISDFAPGATVYVEGHLARQGESRRVSVIAGCAWSILPAPPPPVAGEPTSSHASPREHQRSGHPRRVAIGTWASNCRSSSTVSTPRRGSDELSVPDRSPKVEGSA